MKKYNPTRKVGLITFNNEVCLIGDGSKDPLVIETLQLVEFDSIFTMAENNADELLQKPIIESFENLTKKFDGLKEKGATALGPALLAAVAIASKGKPGSMVIICTDGLANVGLGELESNPDAAEAFY